MRTASFTKALLASCMLMSIPAYGADVDADTPDTKKLLALSLNELSDIEVTSVSKRSEKASEAPAAIFVITNEDIRRSGATSIPEALRMAPGLTVARAGAYQWAISARGFNDQFANKLLVLMDGRTIYTPLFSGVFWDAQDTMMEDIDRIEVIRGPGATLWGANAVNGVINIITKKAKDTQGALAVASLGTQESGGRGRLGGHVGDHTHYRAYAKYTKEDDTNLTATQTDAFDGWSRGQSGFRVDSQLNEMNHVTVQGDAYRASERSLRRLPQPGGTLLTNRETGEIGGANIMARMKHELEKGSELTLQMYWDHTSIDNITIGDHRNTFDIDFQHAVNLGEIHEVVYGGGYRLIKDEIDNTFYINFTPRSREDNLFSFFAQDKITLLPEELFLTLGSKFESNDYTGFELQPSARIAWLISDTETAWASVSKAIRTPNRSTDDVSFAAGVNGPLVVRNIGDRDAVSEKLIAYEAGFRTMPTTNTSFDLALFFNDYDNLITNNLGAPTMTADSFGFPAHLILPVSPVNQGQGHSWGGELTATWDVNEQWRLTSAYSLLQISLRGGDASVTNGSKSPQHQFNVRSHWQISNNWEMDNIVYYVDEINPSTTVSIPDYIRFDTRIGYKLSDGVEFNLVGQNLLDDSHSEFSPFLYYTQMDIPRSVYGSVTLRF